MSGVQLSIKVRGELVAKRFEDFAGETHKIGSGRIRGRAESIVKRVSTYPPRYAGTPEHHWASEKQRKAVMAMIRAGDIKVPYQRTGGYGSSWKIEKTEEGYRVRSTYAAAKHITGTATDPNRQYHIHKTRWTALRTATEEAVRDLPKEIQGDIVLAARRKGFSR